MSLGFLPGHSYGNSTYFDTLSEIDGEIASSVVGMHEMEGGRWDVKIAPAYIDARSIQMQYGGANSNGTASFKAVGAAFSVQRELSPHWGVGFIGSYTSQQGNGIITGPNGVSSGFLNGQPAAVGTQSGGIISGTHDYLTAVTVTWDPFSGKDAEFRMPITVGPAYMSRGMNYSNTVGSETDSAKITNTGLDVFANISFDILVTKYFRLMPGALMFYGNNELNYNFAANNNGAITSKTIATRLGSVPDPTMYVDLLYRPWNVTLNYSVSPGLAQNKVNIYSLTWAHKWGVGKEEQN